jgi:hypothetical protein
MPRIISTSLGQLLLVPTLIGITSCESQDRRLVEFAQQSAEQQARHTERVAQQSESVVRHSQELTSAAHELVAQDAAARREIAQAHDQLQRQNQAERSVLDHQRATIEAERKAAAAATVRDPVIAEAIVSSGLVLAAALPLLVTLYALRRLPEPRPVDVLLGNTLLEELVGSGLPGPTSAVEPPALPEVPPPF